MLVSVIIPNYNHAPYLQQRIDSVLNQTYTDFELIILDDNSTDNSIDIINRYKTHPKVVQVVINQRNSGSTFKQWDKGIALAKNEYVWIAESDDFADKYFLENAMTKFNENNALGLFFCNYYSIDEQGTIIQSKDIYTEEFVEYFRNNVEMNGMYFCEHYLFFSCLIVNASGVVFKKSLFLAADKSYMQLKIAGDWRMWVNICYKTNIFFDERKLNYFRMHPKNVRSVKSSLMGAEAIKNLVYFVQKTENKDLKQKLKNSICKTWIYSFYLNRSPTLNARLIKKIMHVDLFFPLRLMKRMSSKLLRKS